MSEKWHILMPLKLQKIGKIIYLQNPVMIEGCARKLLLLLLLLFSCFHDLSYYMFSSALLSVDYDAPMPKLSVYTRKHILLHGFTYSGGLCV